MNGGASTHPTVRARRASFDRSIDGILERIEQSIDRAVPINSQRTLAYAEALAHLANARASLENQKVI